MDLGAPTEAAAEPAPIVPLRPDLTTKKQHTPVSLLEASDPSKQSCLRHKSENTPARKEKPASRLAQQKPPRV